MAQDLLLEIGVEELPASFVAAAVEALPALLTRRLAERRLGHGVVSATGTPRRLALLAEGVAEAQADLDEQVLGPPARIAFDAEGNPTKAALAFASRSGCEPSALTRVETDKGEYAAARRREQGQPATLLLPAALEAVISEIPFRKSMRWSDGDVAFGRPVRWLVALFGATPLELSFAGVRSGVTSRGHRFLAPGELTVSSAKGYVDTLRGARVLVDMAERERVMLERLRAAAAEAGGALIEDEFLMGENASLVEEPQVVVGGFDPAFLALPERVILDVAKGHQRYFGVRGSDGRLLPKYLAVVNTAERPDNVRRGNDRVMRARLADAKFFYDEDLARPLGERRSALDGVMFHKRLGSVGDKVRRVERLVGIYGASLSLAPATVRAAEQGAALAKCDLVTLMVGELPELQGEMGRAYARAQGVDGAVADVIAEHYQPRGADDVTAPSDAGALVAIADRLDTLTGCFAVGIQPTGAADPLALRRAALGVLRTLLDKGWHLGLAAAVRAAHAGLAGLTLDHDADATAERLATFLRDRLRGLLVATFPSDAVEACLAAGADDPTDVALRARALGAIDAELRATAGEVFKRAANIARDAPPGDPRPPAEVHGEVHPSEQRLFDALTSLERTLEAARRERAYDRAIGEIASFAPALGKFFEDVFVMAEEQELRDNRLRLMRRIEQACSGIAAFNLLARER
ncbi:MAG: glycine--tRNA ligase subunit beta [Sorangiineae bacterium]|nr:glycine--tRNA ligase subunit beta [Polyangiaceae bacterium]MEB2323896.1 glycine--tRNA ligase subunit beta [Sorangiineae bacterium]